MSNTNGNTRVRSTKKYKTLVGLGLNDAEALAVLGVGVAQPVVQPVQPSPVDQLVAAGFTEAEAQAIVSRQPAQAEAVEVPAAPAAAPVLTPKQQAEALVAQAGLAFTRGRVYVTPDIIEAAVRVRKTSRPEVVQSSGVGRTAAVLISREETGDVSIQNLARPA